MKKIFIALFAFASVAAQAQIKNYCLAPSCNQTVDLGDSAFVFANLTAPDGFGYMNWSLKSGPVAVAIPTVKMAGAGVGVTQTGFVIHPTAPGTYVFSVTGASLTGTVSTTTDTLFVNAVPKRIAYITVTYTDSTRVKTQ